MATVKIPDYWTADDRSNVILRKGDTTLAWFHLDDGHWLFVSHATDFEPSVNVSITAMTAEQLAEYIQEHFGGWAVERQNINAGRYPRRGRAVLVGSMDTGG